MNNNVEQVLSADLEDMQAPVFSEIELAAIEDARQDVENIKKELEGKKYLVDLSAEDQEKLELFIAEDAPWTFTESLGIIEASKEISKSRKEKKNIFVPSTSIEAMYYYLSKTTGRGNNVNNSTAFSNVGEFIRVMKAVSKAIENIRIDNKRIQEAEFVLASREQGVYIEPEKNESEDSNTK
jgi:hypothetical protein